MLKKVQYHRRRSRYLVSWSYSEIEHTPEKRRWNFLRNFKSNKKTSKDYLIKIKLGSLIAKKDRPINFSINVNDLFIKKLSLRNVNELNESSIELKLKKELITDNIHYIKFKIDNPISPLELFQSPDARKLGLLVESIEILID